MQSDLSGLLSGEGYIIQSMLVPTTRLLSGVGKNSLLSAWLDKCAEGGRERVCTSGNVPQSERGE
jgi:hypothetical protein